MTRAEIEEAVSALVVAQLGCEASDVSDEATLADLGADDLDVIELIMAIEETLDVDMIPDLESDVSFSGLIDAVEKAVGGQSGAEEANTGDE